MSLVFCLALFLLGNIKNLEFVKSKKREYGRISSQRYLEIKNKCSTDPCDMANDSDFFHRDINPELTVKEVIKILGLF